MKITNQPIETLKVNYVKHSGLGENALHIQAIAALKDKGLESLNTWCIKHGLGFTYDKNEGMIHIYGNGEYSFECYLLTRPLKP